MWCASSLRTANSSMSRTIIPRSTLLSVVAPVGRKPRPSVCSGRMLLLELYLGMIEEYVSVVGTDAFMDFVESIQAEGVVLERKAMGEGTGAKTPLVVEV